MENKRVKDLMLSLSEYATIDSKSTIHQALVALSKAQMGLTQDRHHHRAILVLDEKQHVVGKLTYGSILRSLEPKLFKQTDHEALSRSGLDNGFIASLQRRFEQWPADLTRMCQQAARVRVRDAMVPVQESIDEDAGLTEAIRMLVVGHWQSLLVTRDGEVVGILRLSDIFEEVADMIRNTGGSRGEP
jgi:predicted transcriptional regulator